MTHQWFDLIINKKVNADEGSFLRREEYSSGK
jgi:hypothetical protein